MLGTDMFKKTNYIPLKRRGQNYSEPSVPEGMWTKCDKCGELVYTEDLIDNYYECPKCGNYFRIDAMTRISMIFDTDTFEEWDRGLDNSNPLNYPGYKEKVEGLKKRTGLDEAVVTGCGTIEGEKVVVGICDTRFLMGSMGQVVGEKLTRAIEKATEEKMPVVVFTCSGGARMQEGIVSLMQMAKTSAAVKKHSDAGLFYMTILTDPTTGGVTASFAMLGDVILAEPGALVGFAGPRVIQQTIGQKLPEGFQRAEFLVEHGLIDGIVERKNLACTIADMVKLHRRPEKTTIKELKAGLVRPVREPGKKYTPWDKVRIARNPNRKTALDYIEANFDDFYELHGDRTFRDDKAIVGGIAFFAGQPVTVIGQQKGRNTKENIERNFSMPYPEGYRKALRLMKQAEKFNRPVICFVDTPGAFCGIEAEERGQGEAIARNLFEMAGLTVPVLSVVIGEGGSGGALAMAVANEVWMMEHAIYSVLSPEGFASILWKDSKKAKEASEVMKITAQDIDKIGGIIDKIVPECEEIHTYMKKGIADFLEKYTAMTAEDIVNQRYQRYRHI